MWFPQEVLLRLERQLLAPLLGTAFRQRLIFSGEPILLLSLLLVFRGGARAMGARDRKRAT